MVVIYEYIFRDEDIWFLHLDSKKHATQLYKERATLLEQGFVVMKRDYFSSPQKGTIGILLEVHVSILLKLKTDLYLTIHTFIKYKKNIETEIDK